MTSEYVFFGAANVAFALLISPFYMSLIRRVKARVQRRRGPPLMQTYHNLLKLWRKERVYSENSSWVMRATPYANMAIMLVAALCVPLFFVPEPPLELGNVILFLYLLTLARFFMALSGLDAGSTFGGMGSSREMSLSSVVEPITIIVFAALAYTLKTINLHEMFVKTSESAFILNPASVLISIPLFIVMIVETARVPVDNPETHLELTMVHEAMILEYSGRDLALMELSHALKQTLLMGIIINVLFPWGLTTDLAVLALAAGAALFAIKASVLAAFIGIFESSLAKTRFFALPGLFMIAFFLSVITIMMEVFR